MPDKQTFSTCTISSVRLISARFSFTGQRALQPISIVVREARADQTAMSSSWSLECMFIVSIDISVSVRIVRKPFLWVFDNEVVI
jgi:hypothetical protein